MLGFVFPLLVAGQAPDCAAENPAGITGCAEECKDFCCLDGVDIRESCYGCPKDSDCITIDEVNKYKCNQEAFDYSPYGFDISCKGSIHHSIEVNVQRGINEALLIAMNVGRFLMGNGTNGTNVSTAIKVAMVMEVKLLTDSLEATLNNQSIIDSRVQDLMSDVRDRFNNTAGKINNIKAYARRLKEWIDAEIAGTTAAAVYTDSFYGLTWDFPTTIPYFPDDLSAGAGLGSLASLKSVPLHACKQARFVKLYTNKQESQQQIKDMFKTSPVVAESGAVADVRSCSTSCASTRDCDFFAYGKFGAANVCAMMAAIAGTCEEPGGGVSKRAAPPTYASVPGWVSGSAGALPP